MFNVALHKNFKIFKWKKLHSFEEALIELKKGKYINRYTWDDTKLLLCMGEIELPKPDPFGNTYRKAILQRDTEWQPTTTDILGLDWLVW